MKQLQKQRIFLVVIMQILSLIVSAIVSNYKVDFNIYSFILISASILYFFYIPFIKGEPMPGSVMIGDKGAFNKVLRVFYILTCSMLFSSIIFDTGSAFK